MPGLAYGHRRLVDRRPASPGSKFFQRGRLQHSDLVTGVVDAGPEEGSVHLQTGPDLLRRPLLESEEALEPVGVHGGKCWLLGECWQPEEKLCKALELLADAERKRLCGLADRRNGIKPGYV